MLKNIFFVGAGGFGGSALRYLTGHYLTTLLHTTHTAVGTFAVNIIGSFLLGLFLGFSEREILNNGDWKLFLVAGFCGGFTTFSSFAAENLTYLQSGKYTYFFLHLFSGIILGLSAVLFGFWITKLD